MWILFSVSVGTLTGYLYLMLRQNRILLRRLLASTGSKEWGLAGYMVLGLALITGGVYFVPDVPNPNALPAFHSSVEAFVFALSWGILFFLATISYGLFKNHKQPEFYLLGLSIFFGAFSLIYYPLVHSDYGSQFIHGLLVVGVFLILSVDQLSMGPYSYRFIWGISWFVLSAFSLWLLFTGISAIFRFEPRPEKALLYTWFVTAGAVWLWIEGLFASGRKRQDTSLDLPAVSPDPNLLKTCEASSALPPNDLTPVTVTDSIPINILSTEPAIQTVSSSPSPSTEESVYISTCSGRIPLLRVFCLGTFRVQVGEKLVSEEVLKRYQKPFKIIKLLAVSPKQKVSKERFFAALWVNAGDPEGAFRRNLTRLRDALEEYAGIKGSDESYVVYQGGSYTFHPDYTLVDIQEFLNYVNIGKRYLEEGWNDKAIDSFQKADELCHGAILEDHDPEPWFEDQRKRIEETSVGLYNMLTKLLIRKQDFAKAEFYIKKGLAVNPYFEEGACLLALAQYMQGEKSGALKTLTDFISSMEKKFKTDSSHVTSKLYTLIRKEKEINPTEWI